VRRRSQSTLVETLQALKCHLSGYSSTEQWQGSSAFLIWVKPAVIVLVITKGKPILGKFKSVTKRVRPDGCHSNRTRVKAMKLRVSMVTLGVDDIEKSEALYRDGLGFPQINSPPGVGLLTNNGPGSDYVTVRH